jgi:hypothetical protein
MGLKDRLLNTVAALFSPTMDHPAKGGMTGDESPPAEDADEDDQ